MTETCPAWPGWQSFGIFEALPHDGRLPVLQSKELDSLAKSEGCCWVYKARTLQRTFVFNILDARGGNMELVYGATYISKTSKTLDR
jgi:hypothetical protein